MSIGQRLKEARIARHMKQDELAAAVGVTKGAIGNYETEVSSPKDSILIKLMDVLQVDANFIYQDYMQAQSVLHEDEIMLLSYYRGADDRAKEDALRMLADHQKKDMSSKAE